MDPKASFDSAPKTYDAGRPPYPDAVIVGLFSGPGLILKTKSLKSIPARAKRPSNSQYLATGSLASKGGKAG